MHANPATALSFARLSVVLLLLRIRHGGFSKCVHTSCAQYLLRGYISHRRVHICTYVLHSYVSHMCYIHMFHICVTCTFPGADIGQPGRSAQAPHHGTQQFSTCRSKGTWRSTLSRYGPNYSNSAKSVAVLISPPLLLLRYAKQLTGVSAIAYTETGLMLRSLICILQYVREQVPQPAIFKSKCSARLDLSTRHPAVDEVHEFSCVARLELTRMRKPDCSARIYHQSLYYPVHRVGRMFVEIRYMIYLAQTCRMITEGGFFKNNVKGSGQIADAHPAEMWRAAGCADIYPDYDGLSLARSLPPSPPLSHRMIACLSSGQSNLR